MGGNMQMDLQVIDSVRTMDSREIAELTGKRHADVIRDIEAQLSKVGDERSFASVYKGGNGEMRRCYKLPYRETMILVSGYSVELRAKVVDRWIELEKKEAARLPSTFAEALRLAADQAEKLEAQKKRLEIAEPKAEFFDRVMEDARSISMEEAAKVLNFPDMGRNKLFAFLRHEGILTDKNLPYQVYIDCNYFRVIETITKFGVNRTTRVYQRGLDFIRKRLKAATE